MCSVQIENKKAPKYFGAFYILEMEIIPSLLLLSYQSLRENPQREYHILS
jgi:hypothetical protein